MKRWMLMLLGVLSLGLLSGCDQRGEPECDECKRAEAHARERALLNSCKDCVPAPLPPEAAETTAPKPAAPIRKAAAVARIEIVQNYQPEPQLRASERRPYARSGERDSD